MDTSNRLLLITQVVVGFIAVIWGRAPALLQLLTNLNETAENIQ